MKILHTSDWHLGEYRGPVKNGVNLRSEDIKRCLDRLVSTAKEQNPDFVLVSGDIFDVGRLWSDRCCEEILTAIRYIRELSAAAGHVIVMRGTPNHDGTGQFNVLSEMFSDSRNVHIVTSPQVLAFEDVDIAALPGFDRGRFRAEYPGLSKEEENEVFTKELSNIVIGLRAQCGPDKLSVLMSHYTVPGANTESGQVMLLTQFEPILPPDALKSAGFDLVALGHIHRPQEVPGIENCFYSGAVNALNFNDEGQERGFWIHHAEKGAFGREGMVYIDSEFVKTPIREFLTLHFTDTDITAINLGKIDEMASDFWRYNGAVKDRIVRIHYSCSADNAKAYKMKEALVEKTLLEDGAFMLWENLPVKVEEFANRTKLANTTDPEGNLIEYLEEKQLPEEKIRELVLMARPVIAEAAAARKVSAYTGIFEPVEISVKNYRNYEEETFHFGSITFCTINGQNGAGKSSLFMDAIIDCLYEEPREGEKTGWIRNDEKARSGSILFTFRIGGKTFRVTRTRTRSGKGTLNLAELTDEGWKDCSKERYNDTQQEIIDIIGMDSFTFKSCALIMQDQYGLFLQAKPEERVEVLGTLLGLGTYQVMEKLASDMAKSFGAKSRELGQEIEIHNGTIDAFGKPDDELAACRTELAGYESILKAKTAECDKNRLLLANRQEAAERREKLLLDISVLQGKKRTAEQNRVIQQEMIDNSKVVLNNRMEIEAKVAEYNSCQERERILTGESALFSARKREAENLARQASTEQEAIDAFETKIKQKENELSLMQPTDQDAAVREKAAEYERQKILLDEAYEKERSYRAVEQRLTQAVHSLQRLSSQYDAAVQRMQLEEETLKKKAELLSNVECVDISNAKCGFLADAVSAKQSLKDYPVKYEKQRKAYEEQAAPFKRQAEEFEKQLADMDFDTGAVREITEKVNELKPYVARLEAINQREGKIALLKADIEHLQLNIHEAEKRLSEVRFKRTEAVQERDRYAKAYEEHAKLLTLITALEPWLEKEKHLPVAEERKATAEKRVLELTAELADIDTDITEKQEEADKELLAMSGMEELAGIVARMNTEAEEMNSLVKERQMKIGALQQKSEQIASLKKEIKELQEKQTEYAKKMSDYEILKTAFGQSGVPHQIIRSIIPQLTATSNNILGQMTGGKMGVEFRLERLQKNGKEKVSLDIFVEEHGKAALPYLSKSGGEKVKSSLSVILSLAEMKSTSAGIQLGMLFIDEPPFLDVDGMQAYCDALETIQERYGNIKIMAITHDPAMKARFPQNLDVVKTEHGSKVIY